MNPINEQARTTRRLTERGRIGIFNRSYYEEVLIVRVHPEILRGQGLPEKLLDEKTIRKERYRSIVDLEDHLYRNGTRAVKVSPGNRRKRNWTSASSSARMATS
jgi:polyphosphate kinase 2 (PPK2 family)